MQVRGKVAEAGEIYFIRPHHFAYRRFDGEYGCHQMRSFGSGKIGHFLDVLLPDHAAETGIVGILNQHCPATVILPEQCAANLIAQLTNRVTFHVSSFIRQEQYIEQPHNSTRSMPPLFALAT